MPLILFPRLLAGAFVLTLALPVCANTAAVSPAKPAATGEASLEYIIAASARLTVTDSNAELARLHSQLENLRREDAVLRQHLRAKQAEEARLRAAGSSTDVVHAEIQSIQDQLTTLENEMQLLNARIQTLESRLSTSAPNPVAPANVTKVPPVSANQATFRSKPVIAPDQIKAAAARFSGHPAPSSAEARQAATGLLTAQPGRYSDLDIEQVALLVMQQTEQDNEADLRNLLAEMKQKNDQQAALRAAQPTPPEAPDNPNEISPEDRRRLGEISDRQTKLEHAIIELAKKTSESPAKPAPNPK